MKLYIFILGILANSLMFGQTFNNRCHFGYKQAEFRSCWIKEEREQYMSLGAVVDSANRVGSFFSIINKDGSIDTVKTYFEDSTNVVGTFSVQKMQDNGYFAGGYHIKNFNVKAIIIKYDSLGNYMFSKTFKEEIDTTIKSLTVISLLPCSDKGIVIMGWYQHPNYDLNVYMAKLDSIGNLQWGKRFKTPKWEEMWNLSKHIDGGYVLSGYKQDTSTFDDYSAYAWFVRTDEYGNKIQEYLGQDRDTTETYSRVIHSLPDGTYLCGGADAGKMMPGQMVYTRPEVARRDANFNMMWRVPLGSYAPAPAITEIIPTQDGNFVIGGTILQRYPQYNNSGPFEGFVAKITLDGQVLWQRHYQGIDENHPGGLPPNQKVYDMKLDKDENILICGTSQSNYNGNIPMRAWLLKLDKDGCLVSGCGNVAVQEIQPQMPLLSAYPNPAQNEITFRLATEAKDCTLSIYDLTSKQVYQGFLERETQVTTQTWAEGIYFYQVKNEKGIIASGKFVIHH